jgi:hypothetical protein
MGLKRFLAEFCRLSCLSFLAYTIPGIAADTDLSSIVVANGCSGSIVRFDTSLDTDAAMVLTNGHCSYGGYPKPNEFKLNAPSNQLFQLRTKDGNRIHGKLRATRLLYSTMTGTDIALYQLAKTLKEFEEEFGMKALTLSRQHPKQGSKIFVVSGLSPKGISGEIYSCAIERFVYQLKEGKWVFDDSIKYSKKGCSTEGGASGSPVLAKATGHVIGVHSTKNESGGSCTEGNPCEISNDGKIEISPGAAYAQQTYLIYTCVDSKNQIDLTLPGCRLTR